MFLGRSAGVTSARVHHKRDENDDENEQNDAESRPDYDRKQPRDI